MADAGTLCTTADIQKKAGAKASTTSNAEAYTNVYVKEAEGFISAQSRYNWVTNYAGVSAIGKELLRTCASAYAAINVIEYDMSGFSSRTEEAQVMIDVLWSQVVECINLLRDDSFKSFIINGDES